MKNIKISVRLSALVVFYILCVLLLSSFFISTMSNINESSQVIAEDWLPICISASNINNGLSKYRANEYKHVILKDKSQMEETQSKMSKIYNNIQKEISNVEKYSNDENIKECIETIKTDWKKYTEESQEAVNFSAANKKEEAMNILLKDSLNAYNIVSEAADKLIDICKNGADDADKAADTMYAETSISSIIAIIIAIIITALLNFLLIKSITVPIRKLKNAAVEIANGNLDITIDVTAKDEIGDLSYNFNKTVGRLNDYIKYINEVTLVLDGIAEGNLCFELKYDYSGEFKKIKTALENISNTFNMTMGNINQSAAQVSDGSLQVSDSAQALAQATTEQAGSVQQLVSAMEKISETVDTNAHNAQEAKTLAYSFEKTIEESNNGMGKMTESMDEITETSNEISKIIKLIDDIAFQTNILSLNAAVEAARAGAAGKGFAVVADEVRNLAAKSAEAAKSTSNLIKNSINAVDNGTKIANDTAVILNSVVSKAKKLINTMNSIAESSESQSEAISQIKDGIEQISNVVQTNSATAEESASISQQLNGQAEVLKNLVGRFKLKADYKFYDVPIERKIKATPPLVSESYQNISNSAEISNSFDNDDYNPMPNEIILNENDENAYVPEVNLVRNDNGSDKY